MSVITILQRNIKWRFHNAFTILITILRPILWLVLYSAVAGQTMKSTGIENYTAFILPGLMVLVSLLFAVRLPVFFLSTALFPADSMQGVLAVIININPFTHVINALRSLILYGKADLGQIAVTAVLFIILSGLSFAWAQYRLKKETTL